MLLTLCVLTASSEPFLAPTGEPSSRHASWDSSATLPPGSPTTRAMAMLMPILKHHHQTAAAAAAKHTSGSSDDPADVVSLLEEVDYVVLICSFLHMTGPFTNASLL